jgi:Ca-activated chloride channel homolog
MSVANIMPGDEVEVQLVYSEMLIPTEGLYQFVYPTVVGPRYVNSLAQSADSVAQDSSWLNSPYKEEWIKTPYLHQMQRSPSAFSMQVNLSTGVPLAALSCTSHEPKITREGKSSAQVVLQNDVGNRDFILNYRLSGNEIESGLLLYEGAHENYFLLTVQPPARVTAEAIPPREYIFVLDVSGSMHGFPLDTAKGVIANLIGNLKPTDTFNVLLFSGGSKLWSPASLPATKENCDNALDSISRESAGGGTELEAALQTAVKLPRSEFVSRSIVVVTDGYIAEEKSAFTLIHENLQKTNFFAFGIGSGVNRYLIEGVAHAGQGEPFIVTNPSEAAALGDRFRRYIQSPVLTDIHVKFSGFEAYDVEPMIQPDLFAERPIVMFGKWRGAKKGTIEVSGRPAVGLFKKAFDVASTPARSEHAALEQLWARTRIARLSDFSFQQDDPETIRELTTLGLNYNLLTKYTSFIAVIEELRNPTGLAKDVAQPLPLPEGVSDLAVGEPYTSGAEPGLLLLLALAAVMVIAMRKRTQSC